MVEADEFVREVDIWFAMSRRSNVELLGAKVKRRALKDMCRSCLRSRMLLGSSMALVPVRVRLDTYICMWLLWNHSSLHLRVFSAIAQAVRNIASEYCTRGHGWLRNGDFWGKVHYGFLRPSSSEDSRAGTASCENSGYDIITQVAVYLKKKNKGTLGEKW